MTSRAGHDRAVYRARTKARQLGKRLAGSLARARATTGRSASGSARSSGLLVHVLLRQLAGVLAVERPLAGEQFLVDDGQAVLVAAVADACR